MVNKHTLDSKFNGFMINKLTVNERTIYESSVNESTIKESIFNECNQSTVKELMVPEKCSLIMDDHLSHSGVEFFQFTRVNSIGLVCLSPLATHLLQLLDEEIF